MVEGEGDPQTALLVGSASSELVRFPRRAPLLGTLSPSCERVCTRALVRTVAVELRVRALLGLSGL